MMYQNMLSDDKKQKALWLRTSPSSKESSVAKRSTFAIPSGRKTKMETNRTKKEEDEKRKRRMKKKILDPKKTK